MDTENNFNFIYDTSGIFKKAQTPVEWLQSELDKFKSSNGEYNLSDFTLAFEKAKKKEDEYIEKLPIHVYGLSNTHVYIKDKTVIVRPVVNEETDKIKSECDHPDIYRWYMKEKDVIMCGKCDKKLETSQ